MLYEVITTPVMLLDYIIPESVFFQVLVLLVLDEGDVYIII